MDNHQKIFCPNCGHQVSRNDTFCQNCGYDLRKYFAKLNLEQAQPTPSHATPQHNNQPTFQPRQNMHKKPIKNAKLKLTSLIVILIVLIGGYVFGQHYYSKAATMNRIVAGLEKDSNFSSYFYTTDPSYKMTSNSFSPLSNYFTANKEKLASFKSDLMGQGATNDGDFTYKQTGHHFLIFPKYQIKVHTIYPEVTTNHSGVKIQMNGKEIATSDDNDYQKKIGPILPGQYDMKGTGNVNGKTLINEGEHYLSSDSDSIDLELKTIKFTVSAAPGSVIYINNKRQGNVDSDGNYNVSEMPYSSNMIVTAKYNGITSNPTKVSSSDNGSTVGVTFPGSVSKDDVSDFLNNLFGTIKDLANDDGGDMSDLDDYYVNGSNNTGYSDMKNWIKTQNADQDNNQYNSVDDIEPTVKSITPGPDNTSIVNFNNKYSFDQSNGKEHYQTFAWQVKVKKINGNIKIVARGTSKLISSSDSDN